MTCVDVTENDESVNMENEKRMHDIAVAVGLMVENCTLKPDLEDLVLGAKSLRRRFENRGVELDGQRSEVEQLRATVAKQAAELASLRAFAERVRVAAHAISDGEAVTLVTLALAALDKASKGESR